MLATKVLTYDTARDMLLMSRNGRKKIDNNTYLYSVGDRIAVRLYETDVIILLSDGRYVLNSGGFRTVTTKSRINTYSPACVYQLRGKWHVSNRQSGTNVPFVDGIVVNAEGCVVESPPDINKILEGLSACSKYGASMGRQNQLQGCTDDTLYIQKVEAHDGDYDAGCAYWGSPSDLWCAFTDPDKTTSEEPVMAFVRAKTQTEAEQEVLEMMPDDGWKFYRPD